MLNQQKPQSHRKAVSNTNSYLLRQQLQPANLKRQQKLCESQHLLGKLASLQVLKNLVLDQNSSKIRVEQIPLKKRIRTEGNDKQSFHNHNATISVKKDRTSVSPKQPRTDVSYLKSLLNNQRSSRRREQRNQSADFLSLLKYTQLKQSPDNQHQQRYEKRRQQYDQPSQRYALSECSSALELLKKHKASHDQKEMRQSHSSKLIHRNWISTQQFKEKLSSLSKERKESQQTITYVNDDLNRTHKKYQGMRGRTDTEQPPSRIGLHDEEQHHLTLQNKRLESKIDSLVQQVSMLNKKSFMLEQQNRMLFENLSKIFQLI